MGNYGELPKNAEGITHAQIQAGPVERQPGTRITPGTIASLSSEPVYGFFDPAIITGSQEELREAGTLVDDVFGLEACKLTGKLNRNATE